MSNTTKLSLPLMQAAQAQKHVTHNESLQILDVFINCIILGFQTTPPVTPLAGQTYFVTATATGAWVGEENKLATYENSAWVFRTPPDGLVALDAANIGLILWNATFSIWVDLFTAAKNGTVAAPAFSFFADSNTGMYRVGADSIGFSTGGTNRLTASATGVGLGNVTAPTAPLDINGDSLRLRTAKTPANASDTGVQGQIAWDADYVYVCTATNTWKRAAIATW